MEFFSPVFLLCSERSGSNLLTRLIDSHSEFCGAPPSHIIRTLALNLTRFGNLSTNDNDWRQIIEISASIMQNQLGIWRCTWDAETLENIVQERSVRGIISAVYQSETKAHGKQYCFIKENLIHLFLPYLIAVFPNARYVWMVRDPRDMALSWKRSKNHSGDVRSGAATWLQDQEKYRFIYGYLRESKCIHLLRYEDLIQNPESTLTKLCSFLKVSYSNNMLDFYKNEDTKLNGERVSDWENLAKPLIISNTGKYKDNLSINEIEYIESLCFTEMSTHGYAITTTIKSLEEVNETMDLKNGKENKKFDLNELSLEEQAIRKNRQKVIDIINSLPVRLIS